MSEEFRYFFISYTLGGGYFGNIILKQILQRDGKPDRGMNIANAAEHIMNQYRTVAVILSWYEVPIERYNEWMHFLGKKLPTYEWIPKPKPSLGVIEGGKDKTDTISPILHILGKDKKDNEG